MDCVKEAKRRPSILDESIRTGSSQVTSGGVINLRQMHYKVYRQISNATSSWRWDTARCLWTRSVGIQGWGSHPAFFSVFFYSCSGWSSWMDEEPACQVLTDCVSAFDKHLQAKRILLATAASIARCLCVCTTRWAISTETAVRLSDLYRFDRFVKMEHEQQSIYSTSWIGGKRKLIKPS